MNAAKFRSLALEVDGASEGSHMGHADFRVAGAKSAKGGKVFASMSVDEDFGVVNLPIELQDDFIEQYAGQFEAMHGAWGRAGWTKVLFKAARAAAVRKAITLAAAKVRAPNKPRN